MHLRLLTSTFIYEGHSRINDNEFISRKVLLDSVLFIMPHEDSYMTYVGQKFGAFIIAKFDAMEIEYGTRSVHGRENLNVLPFLLWGRVII